MVGCMEATRQQVPWGFCKFSLGDIFRQLPTIAMFASAKKIQNVVMIISFILNAYVLILSHLLTVHSLGLTTSAMLPLPLQPSIMVTHNWDNLFSHLAASTLGPIVCFRVQPPELAG